MLALLDTSEDLEKCREEIGCEVGQLLTPLTRFKRQDLSLPWAIDNGAFSGFQRDAFLSLLDREASDKRGCRFVVAPDVVGSARRTLEVFRHWRERLTGWPVALAIQDGQQDLEIPWNWIDAVFIGGSTEFKMSVAAEQVIRAAQILDKWVHVGRVNDPDRYRYFEARGVNSIDGTGISRYTHMRRALIGKPQPKLQLQIAD